jgi:hypothetical protein
VAQAVLDVRYDAPGLRMLAEHVMGLLERGLR